MANHVFISYAREDREVANAICASLEAGELTVWIDHRDAEIGASYADSLTDAMARTAAVALVLSSSSARSPHVEREIAAAGQRGIPVFVYDEEGVDVPEHLRLYVTSTPVRRADQPREEQVAAFTSDILAAVTGTAGARPARRSGDRAVHAPASAAADVASPLRRAASRVLRRSAFILIAIYLFFLLADVASLVEDWLPYLESWTETVDDIDLEDFAGGITVVHLMTTLFVGIVLRSWWIGVAASRALEGLASAELVHLPIFSVRRPLQPRTAIRTLLLTPRAARGPWSIELWWPATFSSFVLSAVILVLILMPETSPAVVVIVLLFLAHLLALIGAALLIAVAGAGQRLEAVARPVESVTDAVGA